MITRDSQDVWGYTIFCDDIRVEVGGKLTYVGSYGGRLLVHGDFPFVLPKISLGVVYYQKKPDVVLPIRFWIYLPGDPDEKPSIQAETPIEVSQRGFAEADQINEQLGSEAIAGGFMTQYAQFGFTSLPIPQPGLIKVRAVRREELIRLGTLEILRAPQQELPPIPPQP